MTDLRRIIWLASYPKSGNTWMRTLLAHYFMPEGQAPDINNLRQFTTGDIRQDFFDRAAGRPFRATTVEEWMKVRPTALRMIAASKPDHHFVKTHCQPIRLGGQDVIPADVTAAAIYIMRNPFDLAPSFARHQACDLDTAITRMMDPDMSSGTETGILDALGRWDDHVRAWTTAPGLPRHIIRYEDMLRDTGREVSGLLKTFLRVKVDKRKLDYALRSTSFDALKKQESEKGFSERPPHMQTFFAKGQAGVWRDDLTPEQVGRLREGFLPVLEKWYPEMLEETAEFARGGAAGVTRN